MNDWRVSYAPQVPGLYKIFDEIIVNASDNKQRDPSMDVIKVVIDQVNMHTQSTLLSFGKSVSGEHR